MFDRARARRRGVGRRDDGGDDAGRRGDDFAAAGRGRQRRRQRGRGRGVAAEHAVSRRRAASRAGRRRRRDSPPRARARARARRHLRARVRAGGPRRARVRALAPRALSTRRSCKRARRPRRVRTPDSERRARKLECLMAQSEVFTHFLAGMGAIGEEGREEGQERRRRGPHARVRGRGGRRAHEDGAAEAPRDARAQAAHERDGRDAAVPGRGPELDGQAARERHQRHPRRRDGARQDAAVDLAHGLAAREPRHPRPAHRDRAQVDDQQLDARDPAVVPVAQTAQAARRQARACAHRAGAARQVRRVRHELRGHAQGASAH